MQQTPPTPSRPLTPPPRIALMTETRSGQTEFDILHKIEETFHHSGIGLINQTLAKEPWMEFELEDIPEPEKLRAPVFMSGMRLGGTVRLAAMTKDDSPKTQIKEVCSYCEKSDHRMYKCPDWLKDLNLGLDKPKEHLPTTIKVATVTMEPCEVCEDNDHTKAKSRAMGYNSDSESDKEKLPKGNTIVRTMRVGNVIMEMEVCSFCEKPGHGMDTCRDGLLD
ncbi:hypothetical protein RUND412_011595 [Rhizina undulata]